MATPEVTIDDAARGTRSLADPAVAPQPLRVAAAAQPLRLAAASLPGRHRRPSAAPLRRPRRPAAAPLRCPLQTEAGDRLLCEHATHGKR